MSVFKKQSKPKATPVKIQSHTQRRYFSLMLVPSYAQGKTRSIRIPIALFYGIIVTVLVIAAVITALYLRGKYFMQAAEDISLSLDQAREAYAELQESSESEQNRLIDDSNVLRSQLAEALDQHRLNQAQQAQTYLDALDEIWTRYEALQQQIMAFDEYRESVLGQYAAQSYIPPVKSLLEQLSDSQTALTDALTALSTPLEPTYTYTYVPETGDVIVQADTKTPSAFEAWYTRLTAVLDAQYICYADLQSVIQKATPYINNYPTRRPVYGTVTSGFGSRQNPMGGSGSEQHSGIDIRVSTGTTVRATGGGTVITAGWNSSYGYQVVIDHGFGIHTVYAHNSKILVRKGQRVERGDALALSGSTGRSTGPHVHYEVRVNGKAVNPTKYFLEG